jgi:hypothetical protein
VLDGQVAFWWLQDGGFVGAAAAGLLPVGRGAARPKAGPLETV